MTLKRVQPFNISVILHNNHGEYPGIHQILYSIRYGLYVEEHGHVLKFIGLVTAVQSFQVYAV